MYHGWNGRYTYSALITKYKKELDEKREFQERVGEKMGKTIVEDIHLALIFSHLHRLFKVLLLMGFQLHWKSELVRS